MKKREINLKKIMDELDNKENINEIEKIKNQIKDILPKLSGFIDENLVEQLSKEIKNTPVGELTEEVYTTLGQDVYSMIKNIPQYITTDLKEQKDDEEIKKCVYSICMSLLCYLRRRNKIHFIKEE
jgi:hypothetical protein